MSPFLKIICIPEGEKSEQRANLKRKIAENFPNLGKAMKLRKHLIILMQEDFVQDAYKSMTNNFKGNQVKKVTYTGSPIRLSIHFSPETL